MSRRDRSTSGLGRLVVPLRPVATRLLLLCGAAALALSGCALWRIGQSAELARQSQALQQRVPNAALRLLIVGDSTAVGTGASSPQASLAGLIAHEQPQWWIENRAQFADALPQLAGPERFDNLRLHTAACGVLGPS
jgi:hypothetical protein